MQREGRPISTMLPEALREILVVIGLSVLLPYFRGYFLSPVKSAGIHPTSVLEHAFLAFAVSFVACAVLVLVAGPRALQAVRSRWVAPAAGVVGTLGLLLLWLPSGHGGLEELRCIVGSVANVAFFVVCLLRYVVALERLAAPRVVGLVLLAFGLSFANNLFYLLPVSAQAALCVLSPMVCALCTPAVRPLGEGEDDARAGSAPFFNVAPLAFVVLLSLFCLAGNFVRGITNPWFAIEGVTVHSLYMTLVNLALVAVTLVLLARRVPVNRVLFFNWMTYMLLFFAGVLVMAIAPVEAARVGSNLATTSRVGFTLLMLLFALAPGRWAGMGLARRVGLFLLVPESIAAVVRYVVVPAYLATATPELSALFTYSGAAVMFVLSAAIAVALGGLLLRSSESALAADGHAAGDAPAAREAKDDLVVERISAEYGLTPREADVVRYVSQGYSLKRAAELLGVTINTVRTHMRSVYAKLGIHDRQQLIELAQRMRDEG